MNVRFPLLLAAFSIFAAATFAQSPSMRRSAEDGVLRFDPRGDRPAAINLPVPYRRWETPISCVQDHASIADYYYWSGKDGWAYRYSSRREFDKTGRLKSESHFNRESRQTIASFDYQYDNEGRMLMAIRSTSEDHREQEYYTYDATGILLKDSLAVLEGENWKTASMRWWKLYRDEEGRLLTVTASSYEGVARNKDVISRLEYREDRLISITESVFAAGFSGLSPVFKYSCLSIDQKDFAPFTSSLYEDGRWVIFRRDRSEKNGALESFLGEIVEPKDDRGAHLNELESDANGNLVRMSQLSYSNRYARWDTVADVRYAIEYGPDGKTPSTVVTSYRDSSGNTMNSVKVVYDLPAETSSNLNTLLVYPNPSSGSFRVDWKTEAVSAIRIELLDEAGRLVTERNFKDLSAGSETFDLNGLPSGNYSVRLVTASGAQTVPLVIAH
jgi:hypothetical protein